MPPDDATAEAAPDDSASASGADAEADDDDDAHAILNALDALTNEVRGMRTDLRQFLQVLARMAQGAAAAASTTPPHAALAPPPPAFTLRPDALSGLV